MSLNQAISDHATGTYTVTRVPARGYDSHGRLLPSAGQTTFSILASVQPAEPDKIVDVPEGQSTTDAKLIFTETELRTRHTASEPDRLAIDGKTYVVHTVEKWDHWGETHYKVVALKLENI